MEATVAVTKAATICTSDQSTSASLSPCQEKAPVIKTSSCLHHLDRPSPVLPIPCQQKNFQNDDNTKKRKQDTTEDMVEVYV